MGGRSPSLGASRQWTCSPATSPCRSATTTPAVLPPAPRFPSVPTRSPTTARRRLRAVRDRLSAEYGRPRLRPHRAPIDELVLTVLSQNTGDRNRGRGGGDPPRRARADQGSPHPGDPPGARRRRPLLARDRAPRGRPRRPLLAARGGA